MARDGVPETRTGWVYRSDAGRADTQPATIDVVPVTVSVTPPRAERRSDEPLRRPERGWIESGFYVMTLPLTLTVRVMLAPVNWMFGSRARQ